MGTLLILPFSFCLLLLHRVEYQSNFGGYIRYHIFDYIASNYQQQTEMAIINGTIMYNFPSHLKSKCYPSQWTLIIIYEAKNEQTTTTWYLDVNGMLLYIKLFCITSKQLFEKKIFESRANFMQELQKQTSPQAMHLQTLFNITKK